MVTAIGLHVFDEAVSGFLPLYNFLVFFEVYQNYSIVNLFYY